MRMFDLHPDHNTLLIEVAGDRPDIMSVAEEIQVAAIDCALLLEQGEALSPEQIKQLFTNAAAISQGKKPPGKIAQAVKGGTQAVGNLMQVVKNAATKLQDSAPVQGFDSKVQQILTDYKTKLGPEHKAVQIAQQIGDYAKQNPKKSAFAIAALTGLAGALGTPGAGAAVGAALRGAVGLMKGEKASTVLGKAAVMGGVGAAAGAVADLLGGAEAVAQSGLDIHKPFGETEMADMMKNDMAAGSLKPENIGAEWKKYAEMAYKDEVAKMDLSPMQKRHIYDKIGLQMKGNVLKTLGQANWKGSGSEWGTMVQKALGETDFSLATAPVLNELFGFGKKKAGGVDEATLQQAWEQAGKPTDVASLSKILAGAGLDPEMVKSAMGTVMPQGADPAAGGEQQGATKPNLAKSLQQLDDTSFNELLQQLKTLQGSRAGVAKQNQEYAERKKKAADDEAYQKNSYARVTGKPNVGIRTAQRAGLRTQ